MIFDSIWSSVFSILPRRDERSPITSPKNSSAIVTSNFMIGSSNIGLAFRAADCNAIEPAILNAISDESTSWNEPSYKVAFISTIGYPATTPLAIASSMPFSVGLMYSLGITPPLISSTNSNPSPRSLGSSLIHTSPYWPRPPDCLTNLPCASELILMVSL